MCYALLSMDSESSPVGGVNLIIPIKISGVGIKLNVMKSAKRHQEL